jgi:hypothetical protein
MFADARPLVTLMVVFAAPFLAFVSMTAKTHPLADAFTDASAVDLYLEKEASLLFWPDYNRKKIFKFTLL